MAPLASLGWRFDEGGFLVSLEDGSRANPACLSEGSTDYEAVHEAVHEHLEAALIDELSFTKHELPEGRDGGDSATTPVFCSPGWSSNNPTHILCLIMGKGGSVAPAWVTSVAIFSGLTLGSMLPYCRSALSRGWEVIILNPNVGAAIVEEWPGGEQGGGGGGGGSGRGPAPPELVAGIADFGFSENAAHRAALGCRSTELERAGNWIFARLEHGAASDLDEPLSEADMRRRVMPVKGNENAVRHVEFAFRHLVLPRLNAAAGHAARGKQRRLLVAGTSYAGFAFVRLLEAVDEVRGHLLALAMGDSSHFIDCDGAISELAASVLEEKSRNYVPVKESEAVPAGEAVPGGIKRLHMPSFSAGAIDHGAVPGAICSDVFAWFDSLVLD